MVPRRIRVSRFLKGSFTRIFVRAASGRQRFNVLGAWNAVTRQLLAVTNTTVVNTDSMCELSVNPNSCARSRHKA